MFFFSLLPFLLYFFFLMLLCRMNSTLGKGVLRRFYEPVMEQMQTWGNPTLLLKQLAGVISCCADCS